MTIMYERNRYTDSFHHNYCLLELLESSELLEQLELFELEFVELFELLELEFVELFCTLFLLE